MNKVTIIIDSDDDDDVVEILECAPIKEPSPLVKRNNTKKAIKAIIQNNSSRTLERPLPFDKSQKSTSLPSSSITKPISKSTPSSKPAASPKPMPLHKPKSLPQSKLLQGKPASLPKPRPPPSPITKPHRNLPQRQKPALPRPTPNTYHSPNPIPAPVVIYSTDRTAERLPPLDSVNRMFQRDSRTVTLDKAVKRVSSLTKNPSSIDISKKIEIDSELAAIFAHSPKPSSSSPLKGSSDKSSSRTLRSPSIVVDKGSSLAASPTRQSSLLNNNNGQETLRRGSSLFSPNSLESPPAPTRKRPISSPQNSSLFSRPTFNKKKIIYGIDDEDGEEEDLELYVNHVSGRRKLFNDELQEAERRKMGNKQCPLCYMMFPKQEIMDHSFECNGKPSDKGLKKRTIGTAVAQSAAEREKKNAGVQDTGPTNYYADSEGALALDGSGFGSEVTGLSWESAGQTRFA